MTTYVLDSSALIALLRREPGAEKVLRRIGGAQISSVNWSEVVQKVAWYRLPQAEIRDLIGQVDLEVVGFDRDDAEAAATLYRETRAQGLSLADRACLALAQKTKSVVVTADRSWKEVSIGVRIELIR